MSDESPQAALAEAPSPREPAPRTFLVAAQAVVVGVSFSTLLAGSNAISPLLPVYRNVLHFDPVMLSLTFVCYVSVLAVVLLVVARSHLLRHAPLLLAAALAITIGSDVLLSTASPTAVLGGRAIAGVALGIATGSAAALMVDAIGNRGRALIATGNLVGAVLGTGAALLWVFAVGDSSTTWVFLAHAGLCALILVPLLVVLSARRKPISAALSAPPRAAAGGAPGAARRRVIPYLVGGLGWFAIRMTIVFAPSLVADQETPWVGSLGNLLVLAASAAGQLASPTIARLAPRSSGLVAMALGAAALLVAAHAAIPALAFAGFAVLGYGIGLSYRLCLVLLTLGLRPELQGRVSSLFSAVTYAVAGAGVLVLGALGSLVDLTTAVTAGYALVVFGALVCFLLPARPTLAQISIPPLPPER
jgi:hypothetical protein